ncbi:MAG TPA: zinc ribbon domain-containing protein [Dehalococcoidia bacterium]|nr:zinc ribbon domain-containing protein [Dehalococcoidia bacterium]
MPLYEYYCSHCDGVFEQLRSMREASEDYPCPVCDRDSKRIMPTSFSAFTFRDGYPRRIPDKGTYWHFDKEVKTMNTGGVPANEHPELYKPEPKPVPSKGEREDMAEIERIKERNLQRIRKESDIGPALGPDGKPVVPLNL